MNHGREAIIRLAEEYDDCDKCPALCESRTEVVFGSGNVNANLMVIGEAPGPDEDEVGVPFIGKSGRLLMDILRLRWPESEELTRINGIPEEDDEEFFDDLRDYFDDHVFWTNIVLCRPAENRTPSTKEIKACKDRLHKTIYAVDPSLILALGKTAISALLGKKVGILNKRGTLFDVAVTSPATGKPVRYTVMAILHPSYLLRKGDQPLAGHEEGETYDTLGDIEYAVHLLNEQHTDLFGDLFPNSPEDYKK